MLPKSDVICSLVRLNKKYISPARFSGFIVVIFENERFFGQDIYKGVVRSFVNAAKDFGKSSHFLFDH